MAKRKLTVGQRVIKSLEEAHEALKDPKIRRQLQKLFASPCDGKCHKVGPFIVSKPCVDDLKKAVKKNQKSRAKKGKDQ